MVDSTNDEAEFSADDDEGGGESTVAMQSPSFDGGMRSPLSAPPPGRSGLMPPTSPIEFPPPGAAPEPKVVGMTAPSAAVPQGLPARPKRAQTVIGIAPPGQGAQRPPTPANPLAPRPLGRPVPPPDASSPPAPSQPRLDANEPPVTVTAMGRHPDPLFGLDEAAGAAARAAVRPGAAARHSPLASTGFTPPKGAMPTRAEKPALPRPPVDQESTTTAFVEDLGLPLTAKAPPMPPTAKAPLPLPKLHENEGEDESTRAVPREELLRTPDAQFVVGEDAVGEDATLAVAPGMNEALSQRMAAGVPSPLGADASGPHAPPPPAYLGNANPTQQSPQFPSMLGPPPSWNMPAAQGGPTSQMGPAASMSQMPSSTSAMPMLAPYPQGGPPPGGPQSYPGPNAGPPMGYPGWGPPPGAPGWGPMPGNAMGGAGGMGPMSGPQHAGQMGPGQGPGLAPPAPAGKKRGLSGQVIALGIVGVVCLAIFVTGVVLFFTTKF